MVGAVGFVSDAARVTSTQIYELATYVQQSNPEVARQILSVFSRDVSTMTALGATLGAIMISYLSGKTVRPGSERSKRRFISPASSAISLR